MKSIKVHRSGFACALIIAIFLSACASSESIRKDPSTQDSDPVADEYLDEQRNQQNLEDVPVRIDRTNDSDGEAFVITDSDKSDSDNSGTTEPDSSKDSTAEANTDSLDNPELTEEERVQKERQEEQRRKEEQERLAQLEKERKEREEARRKEEERRRKEAELQRLRNEAVYHSEAFANRQREFEIARKTFRINALVEARDARLGSVYPESRSFWASESEERFSANPSFEVDAEQVYLVKLANPLDYQSSFPVNLPPGSTAIELKDPLAVWNRIKGSSGRWVLMQKTTKGYVPLSLRRHGVDYRVASVEIESGLVKLEIYSRSSNRRAGQYHVLYPVELELKQN